MISFDHLLWSLLTLFTVTTLEGWHEVRSERGSVARRGCRDTWDESEVVDRSLGGRTRVGLAPRALRTRLSALTSCIFMFEPQTNKLMKVNRPAGPMARKRREIGGAGMYIT